MSAKVIFFTFANKTYRFMEKHILHIAPQKYDVYCPYDVLKDGWKQKPSNLIQKEFHSFKEAKLIIINLNYTLSGDFDGVKLLKLIRLHHIRTHCIVYSPNPESYHVRADANKSILLSEGVTFIQIPDFIDDAHLDFATLKTKVSPENLEDYFLHDYKLFFLDNRHFHANWWAPLRIMEYLKRADKIEDEDILYSDPKAKASKTSYDGLVLRYIKTLKEQSVWDSKVEDIIAENMLLEKENRQLEQDKVRITEALNNIQISDEGLKDIITTSATSPINAEIKENQDIINLRQQEVDKYHQAKEVQYAENASTHNIESLRNALTIRNPKILYLDDMAGYGWDFVIQRLIYRKNNQDSFMSWRFFPENANDTDDYAKLAETIIQQIKTRCIDLIIMDLRLKNEKGEMKPQDLSGIKLLEFLREKRIPCPILVITASKNPETIEQVYASGADACWRKEGIDENNSTDPVERVAYTWGKIEQLLTVINTLCGEEFQYLYKTMLEKYYHTIEQNQTKYWWEVVGQHNTTGMESINKADFLKQLYTCIHTYQQILINKLKGKYVWHEFLEPCNAMFVIMEAIHPARKLSDEKGKSKSIKGFSDLLALDFGLDTTRKNKDDLDPFIKAAFDAIKIRNDIVHVKKIIPFISFKDCVKNLIERYLMQTYEHIAYLFPGVEQYSEENDSLQEDKFFPQKLLGTAKISIETGWNNIPYEVFRSNRKLYLSQGQKVNFTLKSINHYILYDVTPTPDSISSTSTYDYAYIKELQVNENDGSLMCQLRDACFSDRVVEKLVHDTLMTDRQGESFFVPTYFKKGGRVEIDFSYNDTFSAWKGRFIEIPEKNCRKVHNLICLNSDIWYKIVPHQGFDVNTLKVGDSIQFSLGGGCILLATDVEEPAER